jgi:hypothetical protein
MHLIIKKIKLNKKMNGGVFWNERLSPDEQVLANRTLKGYKLNSEVKECSKYKNKIVDLKYNNKYGICGSQGEHSVSGEQRA